MLRRPHEILYKRHFNLTFSVVINRWSHKMWFISFREFCQKRLFEARLAPKMPFTGRSLRGLPLSFRWKTPALEVHACAKNKMSRRALKSDTVVLTFTLAFSPPLTFRFSSPVFFSWVLTRGSILLSLVPWIPGSHPFLLGVLFNLHISSRFSSF